MVHIPDVLADPEYAFPKGQQLEAGEAISAFRCFGMECRSVRSFLCDR